jgi:hypothetical protein
VQVDRWIIFHWSDVLRLAISLCFWLHVQLNLIFLGISQMFATSVENLARNQHPAFSSFSSARHRFRCKRILLIQYSQSIRKTNLAETSWPWYTTRPATDLYGDGLIIGCCWGIKTRTRTPEISTQRIYRLSTMFTGFFLAAFFPYVLGANYWFSLCVFPVLPCKNIESPFAVVILIHRLDLRYPGQTPLQEIL